jgi:hypothetical protein
MPPRRFPPPWSVEDYNSAYFIVRDHDGQQLPYIYYEEEPGRRIAQVHKARRGFARDTAKEKIRLLHGLHRPYQKMLKRTSIKRQQRAVTRCD